EVDLEIVVISRTNAVIDWAVDAVACPWNLIFAEQGINAPAGSTRLAAFEPEFEGEFVGQLQGGAAGNADIADTVAEIAGIAKAGPNFTVGVSGAIKENRIIATYLIYCVRFGFPPSHDIRGRLNADRVGER